MKIQGEVVSYAVMTTTESCQNTGQPHNHAFDGWQAMFRYHCPCGVVHDSQAFNVWPTGDDHKTDITHVCPITNEHNEVEIVRP